MRRKKIILFIVSVLVVVFALTSFSFARDSFPEEVIKASRYVVRIKVTTFEKERGRQGSSYSRGSGFFVAPNKVLTASHIGGRLKKFFEYMFSIRSVEIGGRDYLVEVVAIDFARELALLEIKESFPSYVLQFAEPETGDEVYFVGFSGYGKKILFGKVGENREILPLIPKKPKDKFTLSGEVLPGMSGGPILNKEGKVIGLIWGGISIMNVVAVTPVDEIKEFLEENKDK